MATILTGRQIPHIDEIPKDNLSAFFADGQAYRAVSDEIINKIRSGIYVITEYHIGEILFGDVIYVSPSAPLN